ncbi:hypothetical protein EV560_10297 [Bosea sp. BK604]|nr:hypothetical protein EV560_10297 [Bosea sp. BK604]
MPIYYFSESENGADVGSDDNGVEFRTLDDACNEADRTLRVIAAQAPLTNTTFWMTVLSSERVVVHRSRLEVVSSGCGSEGAASTGPLGSSVNNSE